MIDLNREEKLADNSRNKRLNLFNDRQKGNNCRINL